MSKPWGGVGAWALDAERAEAEEREMEAAAIAIAGEAPQSFPSLREAATATKSKKKKQAPMSLNQFNTGTYQHPATASRSSEPRGLTPDEMLHLPTGPRERSAEELESRGGLGGGFRSYGGGPRAGGGGGFPSRRSDEGGDSASWSGGGRRPYGGGFDDEQRRGPPRESDLDLPSRADEVDNWAAGKKSFTPMDSGRDRDRDRYSSLGSSRADEIDNWSLGKKPVAPPPSARTTGFGSGFRDSSAAFDSDRWIRGGGGRMDSSTPPPPNNSERRRLVLDPPKAHTSAPTAETAGIHPSPFGAARPREEVLAEKGLDWKKMDSDIEQKKTSRPTSSHSSRPSSAQSSRPGSPGAEGAPPARPKVNPFGDAKPREVLLQERGKDWRKIDLELDHRRVDRFESDEEKQLKEEINQLKKALTDAKEDSADEVASLQEQIAERESELETLIRELDDKIRFGQRGDMRPGSGAGRPPSQHGVSDESRSVEFTDRPRSRGGVGDAWSKPMDDRRGFHGGREKSSFFGSRNVERSTTRDRW